MKTKLLIFGLVLIAYSCKAQLVPVPQGTIPLENYESSFNSLSEDEEFPEGTYFKDVNGVLDKYLGTWMGSYDNKNYEFQIDTLLAYTSDVRPSVKFDLFLIRYKITDASGNVLANTLNLPNGSDDQITGLAFNKSDSNIYMLSYTGRDDAKVGCGDSGMITLKITNNDTQLQVNIIPDETIYIQGQGCPNGTFAPPFPNLDESPLVLTKQ